MRKRQKFLPNKIQCLLFFLLVNFSSVLGQTTCNNGLGRVSYERLPNQQLQGFDDDVVRDSGPPFRVLEKCQDLCLRDRTSTNNLVRACTSFDFQPGSRIASFSGSAEYEESTCYLTREQPAPEGIGILMLVPNSVHFTEVCLTSTRPERECPSRRYVFERHPRKKLKLPLSDIKEITAANRSDCEDKCLNEFSFVCRSANYDSNLRSCSMSRYTRRSHPELLEDDANSDYLENTCLNAERRCDGLAVYVKEENKRLGGPFEVDIFNNMTLEECQTMCIRAEKYFCRSVEFDDQSKQCILSEEDSISQKDDISISSSPTHHFYDLVCLDSQHGFEYPDNSVTSHLFSRGRRPDTAFQRYRNSRLGGEFHSEITGRSLSECLDECLRQTSFQCRSAVYSDRFRTCRLSRYNQRDGMRIIYDADYDYYENLMLGGDSDDRDHDRPSTRPDPMGSGTDWRPPYSGDRNKDRDRDKDRYPGEYYPTRYPDGRPTGPPDYGIGDRIPGGDRYPIGDRYPGDRYPDDDRRIPYDDLYPGVYDNRYPDDSRYPDDYRPGNRDPFRRPGGSKYPDDRENEYYPGRYPDSRYPDNRYPDNRYPDNRYPDKYPDNKYPDNKYPDSRYPDSRYPDGRYPDDRYPNDSRYPDSNRYPGGRYPTRPYPEDKGYYPAGYYYNKFGIFESRYPVDNTLPGMRPDGRYPDYDRRYPSDRRPPLDDRRYPVDDRYPTSRQPPTRNQYDSRYPEPRPLYPIRPDSTDRYPPPSRGRYPVSENRYPIDNDRDPGYIYRNGNRDKMPNGAGYDRYPVPVPVPVPLPLPFDGDRGIIDRERGYVDRDRGFIDRDRGFIDRDRGFIDRDRGYVDRFAGGVGGGSGGSGGVGAPPYVGTGFDGGYDRRFSRPGYPPYEVPFRPPPSGYDNSINNQQGDGFGGYGPLRPVTSRCDEGEAFKQVGSRQKIRRQFVRRVLVAPSLTVCQRECVETKDFICRSFNYRDTDIPYDSDNTARDREGANCELSDRDTRELDLHNPQMFDTGTYDYYEKSSRNGPDGECLDVSQTCNEDGMEFTLRTPEGFVGRIYTYGFYDRCFFRGSGGTVNVLRISGQQGYPECGTQRSGDTMTNIVVVQFSDNVQTGRDKRFNLTCIFRGPGEAVVTSGYIGAGSGSPIPIEYLPAENTLSSKVRLMILYQNRPTTTIAVGDPLTFRLEAQDGFNQITDIFATNVVARDPYSGRSIQLIDRYGCPVDAYVFPELDRLRNGDSLEARFNAFKIPESNFLVFEATVRSCREGCQPAYCPSQSGRSEPSFGRRKREINETAMQTEDEIFSIKDRNSSNLNTNETSANAAENQLNVEQDVTNDFPEHVREMIEVFESREEIENEYVPRKLVAPLESMCLTPAEYHGLISAVILLMILLLSITLAAGFAYRRYWIVMIKNRSVGRTSPFNSFIPSSLHQNPTNPQFNTASNSTPSGYNHRIRTSLPVFNGGLQKTFATGNLARMCQIPVMNPIRNKGNATEFDDPSEPIYTDPSLFERSRSLRSINVGDENAV